MISTDIEIYIINLNTLVASQIIRSSFGGRELEIREVAPERAPPERESVRRPQNDIVARLIVLVPALAPADLPHLVGDRTAQPRGLARHHRGAHLENEMRLNG